MSLTQVCDNYRYESPDEFQIGYMRNTKLYFIISSSFGMIINLIIVISFFLSGMKTGIRKKALIEQMFCLLSIIDALMSVYWLLSSSLFSNGKSMEMKCYGCFTLSLFFVFLSNFDLTYLNIIIHHLQTINANPIDGILNPTKKMIVYLLISVGVGSLAVLSAFLEKVYGISPMLTCYIKGFHKNSDVSSKILVSVFNLIPIVLIAYGIYQLIKVVKTQMFKNNEDMVKVFRRNIIYIVVYFGLNCPVLLLYILTVFIDVTQSEPMQIISFIISITSSLIPLIVPCVRVYQGLVKVDWIQKLKSSKEGDDKFTALMTKNTFNNIEDKSINIVSCISD